MVCEGRECVKGVKEGRMCEEGVHPLIETQPEIAIEVGGTHATGMHMCFFSEVYASEVFGSVCALQSI